MKKLIKETIKVSVVYNERSIKRTFRENNWELGSCS